MMTPAHFFGGYVALQTSRKLWATPKLTSAESTGLLVFGLLLSIGIDLDASFTGGIAGHHRQLTHFPAFWLVLSVLLLGVGIVLKKKLVQSLAIVILVASWTHMALDLVGVTMGIHWLWPFSMKEYSVTPIQTDFVSDQERWIYIMRSPVMWVGDSIVVLGGLVKMSFDLHKRLKSRL